MKQVIEKATGLAGSCHLGNQAGNVDRNTPQARSLLSRSDLIIWRLDFFDRNIIYP
jgi:hypothetical protein